MKGVFSAVLLFAATTASAISTQDLSTQTPQQLAQTFLGGGVTISNVQYTGANVAAGTFTGGAADGLGIDSGVILSTGNIASAAGPNTDDSVTTENGQPGDASLQALLPAGQTSMDATVLEFDFVPSTNRISFRYVFASDEYNEFVGLDFNDIFAFFVDGQNIALIPSTTTPVSIDNVNAGSNASYYRNNDPSDLTPVPYGTQFDGFTVVLTAEAVVTPNQTHHIKLAITDVNDEAYDSAVFFEAASLVSGCEVTVTASDAAAAEAGPDAGTFTITRSGDTSSEVTVGYTIGGTATSGSDFTALSGTVTIPAGQSSATVTVTPVDDLATEGAETVTLTLTTGTCTTGTPATATVNIADNDAATGCVVSISTSGTASENGTPATFTVTRTGSTAAPATITYTVGGSATSSADYTAPSGSVTIPAGQSSATFTITPVDDAAVEGTEQITVTLTGGACSPGAQNTATAPLADNDAPAGVANVPTLGEWALIALAAMLGGLGLFVIRT